MTEADLEKILDKLLKDGECERKYDFPRLQPEGAQLIASNLADEIYELLNDNSFAAESKKRILSDLVQVVACSRSSFSNNECHLKITTNNHHLFVEEISKTLPEDEWAVEIEKVRLPPRNLCGEILQLQRKKNENERRKMQILETVKKFDLAPLPVINARHEVDEKYVLAMFGTAESAHNSPPDITSKVFREKQIKLAYSLVHFEKWDVLRKVLARIAGYDQRLDFEINFLSHLDDRNEDFRKLIVEKFPFVYEKILIQTCTDLLGIEQEDDLHLHFGKLLLEPGFVKITRAVEKNKLLKLRLRNVVWELYGYSGCNKNLIKFMNILLV